ncbi:hypothetical protein [Actinokineospora diospyrosa]|uniref:Uncharacterized protein n=1 Tax=Actinokineospora diospyrosa TaxID=103728 RepID=A0ABT1IKT9_9PSEU|nr:hypothetical protein [Actinokineospora diospyrosa]MCP2273265.1 hypothetical protein [Actinokineospora diospyrosa]
MSDVELVERVLGEIIADRRTAWAVVEQAALGVVALASFNRWAMDLKGGAPFRTSDYFDCLAAVEGHYERVAAICAAYLVDRDAGRFVEDMARPIRSMWCFVSTGSPCPIDDDSPPWRLPPVDGPDMGPKRKAGIFRADAEVRWTPESTLRLLPPDGVPTRHHATVVPAPHGDDAPASATRLTVFFRKVDELEDGAWMCRANFVESDLARPHLHVGATLLVLVGQRITGTVRITALHGEF